MTKKGRAARKNPLTSFEAAWAFLHGERSAHVEGQGVGVTEATVLWGGATMASEVRAFAGLHDDALNIALRADESPTDLDHTAGIFRNIDRLAHQVRLLHLDVYSRAFLGGEGAMLAMQGKEVFDPVLRELEFIRRFVEKAKAAAQADGRVPIGTQHELLLGRLESGLAASVTQNCLRFNVPPPTGLELAALAVLKGLERPVRVEFERADGESTVDRERREIEEAATRTEGRANKWSKILSRAWERIPGTKLAKTP